MAGCGYADSPSYLRNHATRCWGNGREFLPNVRPWDEIAKKKAAAASGGLAVGGHCKAIMFRQVDHGSWTGGVHRSKGFRTIPRKECPHLASGEWHLLITLSLLLLAALVAGSLTGPVRLPKVTAYLLTGVVLGSSGLNVVGQHEIELLKPLAKLAIALVLFTLGCHFPLSRVRRIFKHCLRLSAGELGTTFVLVCAGVLLVGQAWQVAVLLGALALATAPATTVLVLKEAESEGPVTDYTKALLALNNLASIVLFELLLLLVFFVSNELGQSLIAELRFLAQDLFGSVLLGVASGLVVSFAYGLVSGSLRLVLLLAFILMPLALCQLHGMPYLVTFLAMGVVVANSSDQRRAVLEEIDRLTGFLCVVFFVVHGAELDLAALPAAGLVGIVYIVCRSAGKYLGIRWAATAGGEEPAVRRWLGTTLVAQAGAAIALSAAAVQHAEAAGGVLLELCSKIQTIILGTVVVFEIAGPILIRRALVHAGEVPLAQAVSRSAMTWAEQARAVWNRLLLGAGRNPWEGRAAEELAVREVMRKNVKAIPQNATFSEVVDLIEHSFDNTYPVVGANRELVGMIRYRELSSALYDPDLGRLVLAADLATSAVWVLQPDTPVGRAVDLFKLTRDDCLPVVTADQSQQLLGVVRRRDLLRLLARSHSSSQASAH